MEDRILPFYLFISTTSWNSNTWPEIAHTDFLLQSGIQIFQRRFWDDQEWSTVTIRDLYFKNAETLSNVFARTYSLEVHRHTCQVLPIVRAFHSWTHFPIVKSAALPFLIGFTKCHQLMPLNTKVWFRQNGTTRKSLQAWGSGSHIPPPLSSSSSSSFVSKICFHFWTNHGSPLHIENYGCTQTMIH